MHMRFSRLVKYSLEVRSQEPGPSWTLWHSQCPARSTRYQGLPCRGHLKVVDQLRLSRRRTGLGQGLAAGQHVDQRTLAHIGAANEGVFGAVCFRAFLEFGARLDERWVVN